MLTYPNTYDQTMFGNVRCVIRHGRARRRRDRLPIRQSAASSTRSAKRSPRRNQLGSLSTVLWCYVRNGAFKTALGDQSLSADLTGQANYTGDDPGRHHQAEAPERNGGYNDPALKGLGKTDKKVYTELTTDNPIDLTRYQVANCYMGRIGLINRRRAGRRTTTSTTPYHRRHQQAAGGMLA